ncbi:MAG: NAD-dependent epimerase/dehydratase family protein [Pseudomonadota bacterium]
MPERVLISGGTGYIAGHTIVQLLDAGYHVTATVRDTQQTAALAYLRALPGADERLDLVKANLLGNDPFTEFAASADYVLHMASPFIVTVKDPQRDLVEPAVLGTRAMLEACAASSTVKRVVVTSSMAAVTDEPDGAYTLTESDWNETSSLTRNPYYYSKVAAERAAWEFVANRSPAWSLIAINPFMVFGPSLSPRINESPRVLVDILTGRMPAIVPLTWGIVDVRDVAAAHVRALTVDAANGRYICAADLRTMREVVTLLRNNGFANAKLPSLSLESPLGMKFAGLLANFQPKGVRSYLKTHLGHTPAFDNGKLRRDFDFEFRDVDATIIDTALDLARWGHVPQPR